MFALIAVMAGMDGTALTSGRNTVFKFPITSCDFVELYVITEYGSILACDCMGERGVFC